MSVKKFIVGNVRSVPLTDGSVVYAIFPDPKTSERYDTMEEAEAAIARVHEINRGFGTLTIMPIYNPEL